MSFIDQLSLAAEALRASCAWAAREQSRAPMHGVVLRAIEEYTPDVQGPDVMAMHWPHVSTCGKLVAFTPSPEYGERDRQQTTTVGKYLRKFFTTSAIPDHVLRDLGNLIVRDTMTLTTDPAEWYRVLCEGPVSCMSLVTGSGNTYGFTAAQRKGVWPDMESHPYRVYDPALGWAMAVRYDSKGVPLGRAMVYKGAYWVRSFKRADNWPDGYSYSDDILETWLKETVGARKCSGWSSASAVIKVIADEDCIVAPYIDGEDTCVDEIGYIGSSEEMDGAYWECQSARGFSGSTSYTRYQECSRCGRRHPEDEDRGIYLGEDGDGGWVGPCCEHDHYVAVRGRYDWYYVHQRDALVTVEGTHYEDDRHVIRRFNLILINMGLRDGEYAESEDSVIRGANGGVWWCEDPDAQDPVLRGEA